MARNTNNTCLCRVPVDEVAATIPGAAFARDAELEDWCRREGVDLARDYRGRWSIPLSTAYELYERAERAAAEHAAAQAEINARNEAEIATAQAKRQETYAAAYITAMRHGKGGMVANQDGWSAVHKAEKGTPARITDQLGPVHAPQEVA